MPGHQPVISSHLSRREGKGFFQGKHSDNVSFISGSEGKKEEEKKSRPGVKSAHDKEIRSNNEALDIHFWRRKQLNAVLVHH